MNFKELVSTISNEQKIPAAKVRKVVKALADQIKNSIEESSVEDGRSVNFGGIVIKAKIIPARDAAENVEYRPERKRIIVRLKKVKEAKPD